MFHLARNVNSKCFIWFGLLFIIIFIIELHFVTYLFHMALLYYNRWSWIYWIWDVCWCLSLWLHKALWCITITASWQNSRKHSVRNVSHYMLYVGLVQRRKSTGRSWWV